MKRKFIKFLVHFHSPSCFFFPQLDKCQKLLEIAQRSLQEGQSYFHGIEACNEVLDGYGCDIEPALKHEILCTRSALLLKVSFYIVTWFIINLFNIFC